MKGLPAVPEGHSGPSPKYSNDRSIEPLFKIQMSNDAHLNQILGKEFNSS